MIDACRDKNFDAYFAGEGYLIKAQIGGYLATAMKSGDAGIIALIAGAITDPKTGLKEIFKERKTDLNKALGRPETAGRNGDLPRGDQSPQGIWNGCTCCS